MFVGGGPFALFSIACHPLNQKNIHNFWTGLRGIEAMRARSLKLRTRSFASINFGFLVCWREVFFFNGFVYLVGVQDGFLVSAVVPKKNISSLAGLLFHHAVWWVEQCQKHIKRSFMILNPQEKTLGVIGHLCACFSLPTTRIRWIFQTNDS